MIIRKLYEFENAHIVRLCGSKRCRTSIHGHSYRCEILLSYDFGYMKLGIRELIESFDHATTIYARDDASYIADLKKHSARWVQIPLNPSAEQFCRIFFVLVDRLLSLIQMQNGEREVKLHSVIVHETATGYAQCFREDAYNAQMGEIALDEIEFSPAVREEWRQPELWQKLLRGEKIIYPKDC